MASILYGKKDRNPAPFRLTSTEDPTDEQLHYIMEQVGVAARESSRKAKIELNRRMAEVHKKIAEYRKSF